jgi:hypothetical protein
MQKMTIYEDSDENSNIRQRLRRCRWTSTGDSSLDVSTEDSDEDSKK